MREIQQPLNYLGYKGVYCNCGSKCFVVDKYKQYVGELLSTYHFKEVVELDRFETRCGIVPEGRTLFK